jgi:hypothetical protein
LDPLVILEDGWTTVFGKVTANTSSSFEVLILFSFKNGPDHCCAFDMDDVTISF